MSDVQPTANETGKETLQRMLLERLCTIAGDVYAALSQWATILLAGAGVLLSLGIDNRNGLFIIMSGVFLVLLAYLLQCAGQVMSVLVVNALILEHRLGLHETESLACSFIIALRGKTALLFFEEAANHALLQ